jgi:hypothetical protein
LKIANSLVIILQLATTDSQFSMSRRFDTANTSPRKFFQTYSYWLPPAIVSLVLTLVYLNPFIGDWDAIDYTVYSLRGQPSSMALGRSLFTLSNHLLYLIAKALFGLRPEHAYLLFKYVVVFQVPLAVIICWILARDLSDSIRSATVAALLVALSPMVIIYGGQVMTDVPSVLISAMAVLIYLRGAQRRLTWLMLIGTALLGLGVNFRETVGLYFPLIIVLPLVAGWKLELRTVAIIAACATIFVICAFGIFACWYIFDPAYRETWQVWRLSAQREAARHPLGLANLRTFLIYFFLVAPLMFVALPLAVWQEWREHGGTVLIVSAAVGLFATVMLLPNYSTVVNWRYFLTGLPVLAPLAGDYLVRSETQRLGNERRAFFISIAGIVLVAGLTALLIRPRSSEYMARLALAKTYDERLGLLPTDAVVIAGSETVAVIYWRGIGLGHWETIGVGAGWPQKGLEQAINDYLKAGRRVFLDADPRWWQPCAWRSTEISELVSIEARFHFRRLAPTIYEIHPHDDLSATDFPNLHSLLPQNRPDELKRCFNSE